MLSYSHLVSLCFYDSDSQEQAKDLASNMQGCREVFEALEQSCKMRPPVSVIESSRRGSLAGQLPLSIVGTRILKTSEKGVQFHPKQRT